MISKMKALISLIIVTIFYIEYSSSSLCLLRIESSEIGEKCSKQLKKLCTRHDLLFSLWDSSSRQIHTGLTATDNHDLGNYDLCMSINTKVEDTDILGKFCPLQWATFLPKHFLEESIAFFEEFYPKFSINNNKTFELQAETFKNVVNYGVGSTENITIVGSICIPHYCTPEEFTNVFNPYILPVTYNIQNASTNCITRDSHSNMTTFEIIITISICLILLIVFITTIYHVWLDGPNKSEPHDLIKAFSVFHNGKKLIAISRGNADQIQCIHGMKFISMLWVIAGHTFACQQILPVFNVKYVAEWQTKLYSQYIQAGHFAVDTFFFLSGLLLTYGYMKQMKGVKTVQQIKAIPLLIVYRYLRLTPAVAALYFVSLSFFKFFGDGPMWNFLLESGNKICRKYWWRYFLYIQNYSPEICYLQTWYLSADMQMFILAPIVLIPAAIFFQKKLTLVISALTILIVFCAGITITIPHIVDDYTNEYDTHSRLSNYLVGIIGGIIMHTFRGKDIRINKIVNLMIWTTILVIMILLMLYMHDILEYPTIDKTNYFYAIQRPIWCTCLLWIVFSCHHGYGGIINKFLCISAFQIGSRLSYCMYIVHVLVVFVNIGSARTYQYFSDYSMLYLLCGNVVASLILSTIWTLTFEAPMIILNKILLGKTESPKK